MVENCAFSERRERVTMTTITFFKGNKIASLTVMVSLVKPFIIGLPVVPVIKCVRFFVFFFVVQTYCVLLAPSQAYGSKPCSIVARGRQKVLKCNKT